jgi:hypothetical protein
VRIEDGAIVVPTTVEAEISCDPDPAPAVVPSGPPKLKLVEAG